MAMTAVQSSVLEDQSDQQATRPEDSQERRRSVVKVGCGDLSSSGVKVGIGIHEPLEISGFTLW